MTVNYQAWSTSLIGFIRAKGLEHELTEWCGGWKCPIHAADLRTALHDIIALDHHNHGPESKATKIARAALAKAEGCSMPSPQQTK